MSERWDAQAMFEPITAESPCGENLEGKPLFASLDALRLFGQSRSPDAPDPDENRKPPEWSEIRSGAVDLLAKSKDLRLLAYLGVAALRIDGLPTFFATLTVASRWLDSYWGQVYPLVDEDAMARRNALNCLGDPMAVVDRLRRVPLVDSRQHGRLSLRDIDIATGQIPSGTTDIKAEPGQIAAAFAEMPLEQLEGLQQQLADAITALGKIVDKMGAEGGPEVVPSFEPLSAQLLRMSRVLGEQLAARAAGDSAVSAGIAEPASVSASGASTAARASGASSAASAVGGIASRQDAIRALDAVAEFFRHNEPSSPIPMFLARAKRLVAKDFLEVLADIAPEALAGARAAGGVRQDE